MADGTITSRIASSREERRIHYALVIGGHVDAVRSAATQAARLAALKAAGAGGWHRPTIRKLADAGGDLIDAAPSYFEMRELA